MGPSDITAMKLASWGGERVFEEAMEIAKSLVGKPDWQAVVIPDGVSVIVRESEAKA